MAGPSARNRPCRRCIACCAAAILAAGLAMPAGAQTQDLSVEAASVAYSELAAELMAGEDVDPARLDALADRLRDTEGVLPYGVFEAQEPLFGAVDVPELKTVSLSCVAAEASEAGERTRDEHYVLSTEPDGTKRVTIVNEADPAAAAGDAAAVDGQDLTVTSTFAPDGSLRTIEVARAGGEERLERLGDGRYRRASDGAVLAANDPEIVGVTASAEAIPYDYTNWFRPLDGLRLGDSFINVASGKEAEVLASTLADAVGGTVVDPGHNTLVLTGQTTIEGVRHLVLQGSESGALEVDGTKVTYSGTHYELLRTSDWIVTQEVAALSFDHAGMRTLQVLRSECDLDG